MSHFIERLQKSDETDDMDCDVKIYRRDSVLDVGQGEVGGINGIALAIDRLPSNAEEQVSNADSKKEAEYNKTSAALGLNVGQPM